MSEPVDLSTERKRLKKAWITALILLVGLQAGWLIVLAQSATQMVNDPDAAFREEHAFEVPNILGLGEDMHVEVHCSVTGLDSNTDHEGLLVFELRKVGHEGSYMPGSGMDDSGRCDHQFTGLSTGSWVFTTNAEFGSGNNTSVKFDIDIELHFWKSFGLEGHLTGLLLGVLLGGEGVWRAMRKLRKASGPLETHKMAQKEVWEKVNADMEERDRMDADIQEMPFPMLEKSGKDYPTLPEEESTPQAEYEAVDQTELIEESDPIDMDDLGMGSDDGLTGPMEKDQRIDKVRDIYDLFDD